MALAGCASSAGIVGSAKLIDPATIGVVAPAGNAGTTMNAAAGAPIAADWWRGFGDGVLSDLIDKSIAGSPNLLAAQARVARTESNVGAARAAEGPQLTGQGSATRQRITATGIYPPPLAGSIIDLGTLQLNGSWDLDLFGRNRAALDAAVGTQRAAEADAGAARVLVAVNVARNYVQLARLLDQREVLQQSLTQRDQVLSLIRQRVSAGLDTTVELRQGEGALPETRAQIEAIDEQVALARHALAALAVLPPNAFDALTPRLSAVRAVAVPGVVPADLLGRRADIVAARWRVEAAGGEVALARAQFYPNINLTAFVGFSSVGFDRLLRAGSEQFGGGPAISLPIFDAGRLRASLRGRTADLDAAIESYNGNVIDAVRDVADQIGSVAAIERQLREQADAQRSAEAAYDIASQRFRAGLTTYLTVLTAETNVLTQRRLGVDLRARGLDVQMQLVRALGGGYASQTTQAASS
ncbi:MAG: efflux transporter outer membrane subunit [Pseudomonadota bacterium]|nr:efflux transporter outer membrane subunit [Pseudomonadota bacterium]